jgi:hypothetical protein
MKVYTSFSMLCNCLMIFYLLEILVYYINIFVTLHLAMTYNIIFKGMGERKTAISWEREILATLQSSTHTRNGAVGAKYRHSAVGNTGTAQEICCTSFPFLISGNISIYSPLFFMDLSLLFLFTSIFMDLSLLFLFYSSDLSIYLLRISFSFLLTQ